MDSYYWYSGKKSDTWNKGESMKKFSISVLFVIAVLVLSMSVFFAVTPGVVSACNETETISGVKFCLHYHKAGKGYKVSLSAGNTNNYRVTVSGTVELKTLRGSQRCLTTWKLEGIAPGEKESQVLSECFKEKPTGATFEMRVSKKPQ
jgi:hypothetical protein